MWSYDGFMQRFSKRETITEKLHIFIYFLIVKKNWRYWIFLSNKSLIIEIYISLLKRENHHPKTINTKILDWLNRKWKDEILKNQIVEEGRREARADINLSGSTNRIYEWLHISQTSSFKTKYKNETQGIFRIR